tara:strand:+ start:18007 stop:19188 length:1182 start_codon:yes stop_codon:yes gene_type:complete
MKILYVHHNSGKGGSSNSLRMMLEEMVKLADVEILITCPPGPAYDRFNKSGFNLISSPTPPVIQTTSGVRFQWLTLMINLIKKRHYNFYLDVFRSFQPDIIHFNEIGLSSYVKLAKKNGFKTVIHTRIVPSSKYPLINRYVINKINRFTDHVVAIDASALNGLTGLKTNRSIVYNPFHITDELKEYHPDHLYKDPMHVTFLSNFLVHKGVKDVVRTAILLKDINSIKFRMAGANVRGKEFYKSLFGKILDAMGIYPDLEKWVKNKIKKHHLANIELLGDVKNIDPLLRSTHVLVMPNHMNEPSRSVFEAGVYGVPSVISMKDKVEDLVEDGFNGFIVSEKSPQEIAEKILELEKNRDQLKKMGQNARNRFLKLNDSKKSAEQMIDVYKSVLNS